MAFEDLVGAVADCGKVRQPKKAAADVNHPDSFDQKVFDVGAGRVSVSLKDKGALQQTYIFVRATAKP